MANEGAGGAGQQLSELAAKHRRTALNLHANGSIKPMTHV